ncbi:ABC transporter ATP-binding protein [Pseudomonas sp. LS1212]|uniref:ATP-binding cassette domain-containing protein n=1 Tax=Pseudomonas sp. LS1212 TaxID=2972478 RepID=UPI00215C3C17|nr:ABC transporter ATP-binding protein [Pseudomonas sp. LS1212]UVJ42291.1 ABC transporter ATP-binding protein [Pseudomonas sp. LS1212]
MSIISVHDMNAAYKNKAIFKDVSLTILKNSITGMLGPNGSGKTTFFDIICGLKHPDTGHITNTSTHPLYLSQTLSTPATLRMSEIFRLISNLSISAPIQKENIFKALKKWSPDALERYSNIWNKKPSACSYGEIRSFFTLSLLALPSDLIILDEPTAGVDPEFRHYIWLCIQKAKNDGASVIVSSHNVEEIGHNTDTFYMIAQQKFTRFNSSDEYMDFYEANNLDKAFINAASSRCSS